MDAQLRDERAWDEDGACTAAPSCCSLPSKTLLAVTALTRMLTLDQTCRSPRLEESELFARGKRAVTSTHTLWMASAELLDASLRRPAPADIPDPLTGRSALRRLDRAFVVGLVRRTLDERVRPHKYRTPAHGTELAREVAKAVREQLEREFGAYSTCEPRSSCAPATARAEGSRLSRPHQALSPCFRLASAAHAPAPCACNP